MEVIVTTTRVLDSEVSWTGLLLTLITSSDVVEWRLAVDSSAVGVVATLACENKTAEWATDFCMIYTMEEVDFEEEFSMESTVVAREKEVNSEERA